MNGIEIAHTYVAQRQPFSRWHANFILCLALRIQREHTSTAPILKRRHAVYMLNKSSPTFRKLLSPGVEGTAPQSPFSSPATYSSTRDYECHDHDEDDIGGLRRRQRQIGLDYLSIEIRHIAAPRRRIGDSCRGRHRVASELVLGRPIRLDRTE